MKLTKKILLKLSIAASILSAPAFAEENSGWYATGGIGSSQITDNNYTIPLVRFNLIVDWDLTLALVSSRVLELRALGTELNHLEVLIVWLFSIQSQLLILFF